MISDDKVKISHRSGVSSKYDSEDTVRYSPEKIGKQNFIRDSSNKK
jgi:hypothetical protein